MYKRVFLAVLILSVAIFMAGCFNPVQTLKDFIGGGEELYQEEPGQKAELDAEEPPVEESNVRMRETVLYYKDDKGYLVPLMREIKWEEGIARAALGKIIEGPEAREVTENVGLYPPIPAGTRILGLTIRDGLAKIDLSGEALNYQSAKEEELMVKSIVYTLTEFNTVDRVQFMFDGKILDTLEFGTRVDQPMARGDINLIGDPDGSKVTVYFYRTSDKGYQYFVPVTLGVGSAGDDMDVAMRCLLEGPPEGSYLQSDIPEDAKIKGMGIKNGIVYLNFDEGIFDYRGDDRVAENIVKSIALTLKEYPSVVGVKFLVDGKPAVLPNGTKLESAVDVPVFTNIY